MAHGLILAGDVNLMKVTDPGVPFRHIAAVLHPADAVFANLECCLHLPSRQSHANEGFFADPIYGGNRNMASWRMLQYPGVPATFANLIDEYRDKRYVAEPKSIADFS